MEGLQECTKAVLAQMEHDSPAQDVPPENPLFREISNAASKAFGGLWKW